MKKLITACLLLISTAATAQTGNERGKWSITPRVGMTISDYTNDKEDMYSTSTGFSAGVEAEYRISSLVGISGGVFYSIQGAKVNMNMITGLGLNGETFLGFTQGKNAPLPTLEMFGKSEDDFAYCSVYHDLRVEQKNLNIPILVNFHVWKGLTIKTGIQAEYVMSARIKGKSDGFYYPGELIPFESYNNDGILYRITGEKTNTSGDANMGAKSRFHTTTMSIPVGISYEYKNFELDARYHWGVSKVIKSYDKEDDIRSSMLLLTLGYKFNL